MIICRVGSLRVSGQKNIGPCPAHDMVGSGSGWIGLARNFMCNFQVGSDFFEFRVKYFGPYQARHLIGVGSGFFRAGPIGFIWLGGS